jgi:hypothetical protein
MKLKESFWIVLSSPAEKIVEMHWALLGKVICANSSISSRFTKGSERTSQ